MIPFSYRFHGHSSLRYVYKNGFAVRCRLMTIKSTTNPHRKNTRLAIVVSKKVLKSAVRRNRIRRRLYEIMRNELPEFSGVFDIAIIVSSSEILSQPHDELRDQIIDLLTQSNLYKTA